MITYLQNDLPTFRDASHLKRKVLHVLGKTILKLFIQKSIQQNVRIHMITADARSSNVLHDTSTIADTPGAWPYPYCSLVLTN